MEDLKKIVYVQGEGSAMWNSVVYDLSQPVKVALGVAKHWEGLGINLSISDAPEANIPPKEIVNPFHEDGVEAFQGLKRGRRAKEG